MRQRARQFEQNTEERLANLEAENIARAEWPRGFREKLEFQWNEQGNILCVERECSGEEIQKVTTVNRKVSR